MKTINIQNCTENRGKMFSVIINETKYSLRRQFLTVLVDDDKPFKIKVKYFCNASPEYLFMPKENMSLQISKNRKTINTSIVLFIAGMVLALAIGYFYENIRFKTFVPIIGPLFLALYTTIRRKNFFTVKEVVC